eukprot:363501-Chlamydomonas_euryale.AAC.2
MGARSETSKVWNCDGRTREERDTGVGGVGGRTRLSLLGSASLASPPNGNQPPQPIPPKLNPKLLYHTQIPARNNGTQTQWTPACLHCLHVRLDEVCATQSRHVHV